MGIIMKIMNLGIIFSKAYLGTLIILGGLYSEELVLGARFVSMNDILNKLYKMSQLPQLKISFKIESILGRE